jgi:N-acyl-D-aspartate/D-glutamate deacylase
MEKKDPYDVIFDLVAEENIGVIAILFMMGEEDVRRIMQNPWTMIGSDGIPGFGVNKVHPRMTGTFPRVLGKYVREAAVLSLEEAVRKMTSLPRTFGGRQGPAEGRLRCGPRRSILKPSSIDRLTRLTGAGRH